MEKSLKIALACVFIVLTVVIGLVNVWLSLDKTAKCSLVYGKNICNYYAMMDIATGNVSISDFDKMMCLCGEMSGASAWRVQRAPT